MRFGQWLGIQEAGVQIPHAAAAAFGITIPQLKEETAEGAYQLIDAARKRLGNSPEMEEMYHQLHNFVDRTKGGKFFDKFFSDVSAGRFGKPSSGKEFMPEYDMAEHDPYMKVREQYHGNFDTHIKTSIPTFGEIQDKKGHAIVKAFGNEDVTMLDVGGSEGSFARTISHMTNGNIKTTVLDPNEQMANFYKSKGATPGSEYHEAAFLRGWKEPGKEIPSFNSETTDKRYDIIHESMAFQFINNQRKTHISEVTKLLKPGGLFLAEEKLKSEPEAWDHNEAYKNEHHKDKYFTKADLAAKEKVVSFGTEAKHKQDEDEVQAVGMADNMVTVDAFEDGLKHHFQHVWQYWDSGNFRGYAASDDQGMVRKFLAAIGNTNSHYSRQTMPREVEQREHMHQSFEEYAEHREPSELVQSLRKAAETFGCDLGCDDDYITMILNDDNEHVKKQYDQLC